MSQCREVDNWSVVYIILLHAHILLSDHINNADGEYTRLWNRFCCDYFERIEIFNQCPIRLFYVKCYFAVLGKKKSHLFHSKEYRVPYAPAYVTSSVVWHCNVSLERLKTGGTATVRWMNEFTYWCFNKTVRSSD